MSNEITGWRKSLHSANDGACVDVASHKEESIGISGRAAIHVRNWKEPDGPALKFTAEDWENLITRVANDDWASLSLGRISIIVIAASERP